jgi:hypothetical protein
LVSVGGGVGRFHDMGVDQRIVIREGSAAIETPRH